MASFLGYISNIFLFLLFLQVAPGLFKDLRKKYENFLEPATQVGLVSIKGTLTNSAVHIRNIRKCFENKDIKAILIKMECPGGYAGTSEAIFSEIRALKNQYSTKPIVTLVENIAASGGYYIASATDYIIAPASAFIGSIGAYIGVPQVKEFIEKYNIKYDIIKSGAYKTSGSPFTDITQEQRQQLQTLTDSCYKQFTKDVSNRRALSLNDTKKWADGKIFTGDQALELKLIDEIGSFSTAIKTIKDLAHIENKIEWVKPAKTSNFLANLFSTDEDDETDTQSTLHALTTSICKNIEERYTGYKASY
jgi:protease IV